MSLLDDYKRFSTDARASSYFRSWTKSNPRESTSWLTFDSALKAGQQPTPPTLVTSYGKSLVDAGIIYLNGSPVVVPPDPPPVTSNGDVHGPFFMSTSPWRTRVPANPTVDPNSSKWIQTIVQNCPNGLAWDTNDWSTPVYHTTSAQPLTKCWMKDWQVPQYANTLYVPGTQPEPSSDAHAAYIADDTGDEWEYQGMVVNYRRPDGSTGLAATGFARYNVVTGDGVPSSGNSVAGLVIVGGLVLPKYQNTAIPYALRVAFPCLSSQWRYPAYQSDGHNANGPPMGARAFIPASVSNSDLGVPNPTPFQAIQIQCLRDYGMLPGDSNQGQAASAKAESTIDGSHYPLPFDGLPVSVFAKMVFLSA